PVLPETRSRHSYRRGSSIESSFSDVIKAAFPPDRSFKGEDTLLVLLADQLPQRENDKLPLGSQASELHSLLNQTIIKINVCSAHTPNIARRGVRGYCRSRRRGED